jgi:ABC-2 type transport system ATP-binding protein
MRRGTDGDRYLSKVQEGAKVFLDPGESVKAAAWGANSLTGSLLGTARAHIVAVTDRNVYVFESARWRIPGMQLWYGNQATGIVAVHRLGSVPVSLKGWTLRVGGEKVVLHLHHRKRARAIVTLGTNAPREAGSSGIMTSQSDRPVVVARSAPTPRGDLEVRDLARRFGQTVALDGLSFSVQPGLIFGFLGPNGAGKTTAMRIILGIERADSGEARWGGVPIGRDDRLRIGYMPEQRGLYPKMRLLDQLVYLARLHGLERDVAVASATHWIRRLDLAERANEAVEKLSHGNQQRAQLAVALVHDPDLLVLDEPFSGLDPIGIEAMADILRQRAAAGSIVVFSSHQLDLVEDICEDVAIINRGRLALAGSVRELKAAGSRHLVVEVEGAEPNWHQGLLVADAGLDGQRLRFALNGTDPQTILDRARSAGRVRHFAIEEPSLSQLFRRAVAS